jgi:hypothetical protein
MKIELQPEEFTKVLEFTVGDSSYVTLAVNLDITDINPERFYVIEDLSRFPKEMEDAILEEANRICISKLWYN